MFGRANPKVVDDLMHLTHNATQRSTQIRVDNLVYQDDGCLLVEAMFSHLVDLSVSAADLIARLHPTKGEAFEWIITDQSSVVADGKSLKLLPDVQLCVNRPQGGLAFRHFAELLDNHRHLRDSGVSANVRATVVLGGFEPGAEPIVREMHDGSLLLIFAFIPPFASENRTRDGKQFDLDNFGAELERAAEVPVVWDDKEVFVIQRPQRDTIEKLRVFVRDYWMADRR
jgi:hypothetical protein